MYLLLSHESDPVAAWLQQCLPPLLPAELVWITDAHFSQSRRFELRLGNNINESRIVLPDGRRVDSSSTEGVINRLCSAVGGSIAYLKNEDKEYAWQEMVALTLSWLSAFDCPLLNPPAPSGFSGRTRSLLEWDCLANRSGLPVSNRIWNSRSGCSEKAFQPNIMSALPVSSGTPQASIFVIGSQVVSGSESREQGLVVCEDSCIALSRLAEVPLLEIVFARSASGLWEFFSANSLPDLRQAGYEGLNALRDLLAPASVSTSKLVPAAL